MRPEIAVGCGLAAAITLMSGCAAVSAPGWSAFDPATWGYRSSMDPPLPIEVAGPVAVDVDTFNGDVAIRVDSSLRAASMVLTREATHGHGRQDEAELALKQIDYTAKTIPGPDGPVLQIRTFTTSDEPQFLRAHVELWVPAAHGVTVRSGRGSITARGIAGPVFIKSSDGKVDLRTDAPMRDAVTIENRRGDVSYQVLGSSTAEFNCQAIGGTVDSRVSGGRLQIHKGTDQNTLIATLNDGKNPVQLRTADGSIWVRVTKDARQWIVE